jgi:hypothetical protein
MMDINNKYHTKSKLVSQVETMITLCYSMLFVAYVY